MPTDRQMQIMQHLTQHESSEIAELSELLKVSSSTIRRKLRVIENNGLLLRSHSSARLPTPIRNKHHYKHTKPLLELFFYFHPGSLPE